MMATVQSVPVRPSPSAFQPTAPLYPGLSIRTCQGHVRIVTVQTTRDQVFYTVNGVLARFPKTQAGFRTAFMTAN